MSRVDILPATPEDADALACIAFAAKRYWGYPESWIQHWRDSLSITPEFVRNNVVYAAVSGGEPCAFYALTSAGGEQEFEHLWVLPGWIGSGVGRLLFEHAMREAILEALIPLRAQGRLVTGGHRVGERSMAFVFEADSEEEVLEGLPLSGVATADVRRMRALGELHALDQL